MDFNSLKSAVQKGGEHLGDVVWWMLSGADVPRSVLESNWLAHGLDKEFLPEEQTPEKALRLAVKEAGNGLDRTLIRKTLDGASALIYAVVSEKTDAKGNAEYTQDALIMLDKKSTPPVLSTDTPSNDVAAKVMKEYARYVNTHTSRDVMTMITKALKAWSSVTLRETGGIYFVPRTQSDNLRKLQGAIERMGSSLVFILPVHATEDSKRSLGIAAQGSIESELAELRTEIDSFLADPDGVRPSTLTRRLEAFNELRSRAGLYQSILSVTVEDLAGQLKSMEDSVQTMLAQKNAKS